HLSGAGREHLLPPAAPRIVRPVGSKTGVALVGYFRAVRSLKVDRIADSNEILLLVARSSKGTVACVPLVISTKESLQSVPFESPSESPSLRVPSKFLRSSSKFEAFPQVLCRSR